MQAYYETGIRQGRIRVSDCVVDPSHTIRGPDVLTHTVHRHEPAVGVVSADGIGVTVLADQGGGVVVVDKPGTMPVHPCGGYHQNCLMHLLQPKYGKLYTIHRLDRLTSGLVILAKSSQVAQRWGQAIMSRECEKVYLARVRGRFPSHATKEGSPVPRLDVASTIACPQDGEWPCSETPNNKNEDDSGMSKAGAMRQRNAFGYWVGHLDGTIVPSHDNAPLGVTTDGATVNIDDWLSKSSADNDNQPNRYWIHLACPTRIVVPKEGICAAGSFQDLPDAAYEKTVKPAQTAFVPLWYDAASDSTTVLCRPSTGRTHQIRLHLQILGHPIANDPNYGGDMWYGNDKNARISREATTQLDILNRGPTESDANVTPQGAAIKDTPATKEEISRIAALSKETDESELDFLKRTCVWCLRSRGDPNHRDMLEYLVRSRGIWLHALQYTIVDAESGKEQSYRTPLPSWSLLAEKETVKEADCDGRTDGW